MKVRAQLSVLVVVAVLAGACDAAHERSDSTAGPQVVATTTVLGDVVRQIVGDDASVEVLVPAGADPHDFEASARQIETLRRADLVVANGLGLEENLSSVLSQAANDGVQVLEIAELVDPIPLAGAKNSGTLDPHFWQDPLRMVVAVGTIADALTDVDDTVDWHARADEYEDELTALDNEVEELLAAIPDDERTLVTNHDSLRYFADRFGFEVVGIVIPGGSTLAEPSAAVLAELARHVEENSVPVVFAETTQSTELAKTLADEADELGADVEVVELFTGSLGKAGTEADSYVGMIRTNGRRISAALT